MAEAAPLIATPLAPIPAGGGAEWFAGAGGARLRAALFQPTARARGSVVVSPGRTEPIEKYFEVVGELQARGFAVLVHDWRGQGLSYRMLADRTLGHATGYRDFVDDHALLLQAFESRLPKPWMALGHSMGGCLVLLILAGGERRFSGAILSAPMLGLRLGAVPLPVGRGLAATMAAVGLGGSPAPRGEAVETFESNVLTHDRSRWERNQAQLAACPELALGPPTWGWLDFAFSAIAVLERGDGVMAIDIPITVASAGEDGVVDNLAQRRVTARVRGTRFVTVDGAYHEILQETDPIRADFWRRFDDLAARAAP